VDPTQEGKMCEAPGEGEETLNTAKGVLDWKERRRARVKLPTVCSRDKWAIRRLGLQELGHAMDIPGDKIENMSPKVLDQVLDGRAPGKLLALIVASLQVTIENGDCKDPEREKKRKGDVCEGQAKHSKIKDAEGSGASLLTKKTEKRVADFSEEKAIESKR
jgi:hypothetical protein